MSDYTFGQQESDYRAAQVKYALKLKAKLDSGEISQAYYDQNIKLTYDTLTDPGMDFGSYSSMIDLGDVASIAAYTQRSVQEVSGWIGATIGKASGALAAGMFNGAMEAAKKQLSTFSWIVIILGIVVVVWIFLKGPLKGAKVSLIPL